MFLTDVRTINNQLIADAGCRNLKITRLIPMASCNDKSSNVGVWFLIKVRGFSNQSITDASCCNTIRNY